MKRTRSFFNTEFVRSGPHFATGNFEDQVEQLPAALLHRNLARSDASGIDIHQIMPARGQYTVGRHLDCRGSWANYRVCPARW